MLKKLEIIKQKIHDDLNRTVEFWMKHSHDDVYGGFFNCISKDGEVYDDVKYGWLQGRQVWTYCRLYNETTRFHREDILRAAETGAKFLMRHIKNDEDMRCYFQVTRDGRPIKLQRTMFTESFYLIAMAELARATGKTVYKDEAITMMNQIVHWVRTENTMIGSEVLPGSTPTNGLAVPMILLGCYNVLVTMESTMENVYQDTANWCVQQLLAHIQRKETCVLETVGTDGNEIPGCQGRLVNPGHVIEGGWFLLEYAKRKADTALMNKAITYFIEIPFNFGWDKGYGGIFSFLDIDGLSPTQLEWNMKLWWPHCEALVAFLMAYSLTKNTDHLDRFVKVFEYVDKRFVDHIYGEWFGYLNRNGTVSMNFKGGPFKGCFHVPRALLMCEDMLERLISRMTELVNKQ